MRSHFSLYVQKTEDHVPPLTMIDEIVELGGIVYLFNHLFRSGPPLCEP